MNIKWKSKRLKLYAILRYVSSFNSAIDFTSTVKIYAITKWLIFMLEQLEQIDR